MRITRSDNRKLVIVDFPYLIGVIAFPVAAFLLGHGGVAVYRASFRAGASAVDIVAPLAGALFCFVIGAIFTKRSEFDFDFVDRKLRWKRRGLFTNTRGVIPLDQIRSATLQSHWSSNDGRTYRIAVLTAAGDVPLTESYSAGEEKPKRIRDAINTALQVSVGEGEQMENEILDLALAGRKIDAIALARQRYGYDLAQAKQFVEGLAR